MGNMPYFSSSFVTYVGNRTSWSSWLWFYIARPFVGGALAIMFFFIAGSGFLSNSASATNVMTIGVIAALVGLFSDRAVGKSAIYWPSCWPRKKIVRTNWKRANQQTKAGAAAAKPQQGASAEITSTDPPLLVNSQTTTLTVKGLNFNNYKVNGNNSPEVDPEQPIRIPLTVDQTKGDKVTIGYQWRQDNGYLRRENRDGSQLR